MNMSYCRFHNTNIDVEDCLCELQKDEISMSKYEKIDCRTMLENMLQFFIDEGIIDTTNDIDTDVFEALDEFMSKIKED